jgi:antitoxin ParD1/3/4
MKIKLNSKLENLLQQQIISGKYTSPDDVIEEALQLLEKRNQYNDWLEEIRQKIDIAVEKLDRGQGIDGEIAISQLKEYLDNLSLFLQESHQKNQTIQPKALELENQAFVGMWKNRPGMKDSSKWVRKLRQQQWQH